jgi:hypothetical protein
MAHLSRTLRLAAHLLGEAARAAAVGQLEGEVQPVSDAAAPGGRSAIAARSASCASAASI